MKVSEIMTRGVITVLPETPIREVAKTIFKHDVKALPVVDKKKRLLGIVSRENLLERLYPNYQKLFLSGDTFPDFEDMEDDAAIELHDATARDIMSARVVYAHERTPILRALSRMIVRHVNQLPVLSENGVLKGMITKGDIFYSFFQNNRVGAQKRKK